MIKKYNEFTNKTEMLVSELHNIETSEPFIKWLEALGTPRTYKVTKDMLISGYCEDLALYLHYRYGAEVFCTDDKDLKDGHYFVKYNNKFYDAMDPDGYDKPSQSVWSKRLMSRHKNITPEMIDKHLRPLDYIWEVYSKESSVIDKA